jgi:LmbE family N-acetylglucosaminyl deacetylase
MDTAKLELAAQRYREAEAALDAARADLQAEAVTFLKSTDERGAQATVVRVTGWTREYLRRLLKSSEEQTA